MPESSPYRVVQWTTGNVGRDVGTLAGLDPIGVTATNDVDALLTLAPDCVSYNPLWPDVDLICRLLESGIHVASRGNESGATD